ncbi:unnamed protein product, partial [Ectocarpus sp. 8 AP-2014]
GGEERSWWRWQQDRGLRWQGLYWRSVEQRASASEATAVHGRREPYRRGSDGEGHSSTPSIGVWSPPPVATPPTPRRSPAEGEPAGDERGSVSGGRRYWEPRGRQRREASSRGSGES